ncbi:MAG: LPS assembly lipoprotein LptE [Nitrospirae bacterium]|nr:LPS assembly lipoprotein LptE [Nitrospirota bacterium]
MKIQNSKFNRILSLFTIYCSLFALFGCGYTLQNRASLPFESVSIGKMQNKTYEPKLEDRFNRLLANTLLEYGFSVSLSSAYVIEGEITRFDLRPLVEQSLVATQYEAAVKASFKLINNSTGKIIPFVVESPFTVYFSSSEKLENVIAAKEIATDKTLKNLAEEVARHLIYNIAIPK